MYDAAIADHRLHVIPQDPDPRSSSSRPFITRRAQNRPFTQVSLQLGLLEQDNHELQQHQPSSRARWRFENILDLNLDSHRANVTEFDVTPHDDCDQLPDEYETINYIFKYTVIQIAENLLN